MDIKTLEYMGKRVDLGRVLQKEIQDVEEEIKLLRNNELTRIKLFYNYESSNIETDHTTGYILPKIKEFILKELEKHREKLLNEFNEL